MGPGEIYGYDPLRSAWVLHITNELDLFQSKWKRIQAIVRTRTNKQIKSHAQKREKVNPQIKAKYAKGKSRRGRISSQVLADDARAWATACGSVGKVESAILGNAETIPSLEELWKDVYGTNNGDGPNSRHGRYRDRSEQVSKNQLALLDKQQHAEKHPQPQAASNLNFQSAQRDYAKHQKYAPVSRYSSSTVPLPSLSPTSAVVNHATNVFHTNNTMIPSYSTKHTGTTFDQSQIPPPNKKACVESVESLPIHSITQYPYPLHPGTPVYCQTDNMLGLEMHGRWLPGTIHSYKEVKNTGTTFSYSYHILFDETVGMFNEVHNIPQKNVLTRTQFNDWKSKSRAVNTYQV